MIALMKRILSVSGPYQGRIKLAFVFAFLKAMLSKAPIGLSFLALSAFLQGTMTARLCLWLAVGTVGCVLLECLCQNIADRLQAAAGYMVFADLRMELGRHLRRLPMGYFTEGNIGKISSVLSTDMVFIEENCMHDIANMMSYTFAQAILVLWLAFLNPWLGLAALAVVGIIWQLGRASLGSTLAHSDVRQEQSEALTRAVLDYVEGIGIAKTFNLLGERSAELTENFARSRKVSIAFEESQAPWMRALYLVCGLGSVLIIPLSLWLYGRGQLSITFLLGVLLFVFDLFGPMKALYSQATRLTVMNACMDRIEAVLAQPELPDRGRESLPKAGGAPEVEFRNVTFAYGEKEVLHDVSFTLEKNRMLALVGPSGGGKSTVANLLSRFWDVKQGQILVRGRDIRDIPLSDLMDQISMVFQRVYLFQDTVYNNIAMGRTDATREEVYEAARKARCYDFIMELPDGFDTVIGEGGASLSGGERQRISIARCILKDAPIVILDEATASVDADNESYIQEAITQLCRGKTLLVIAHRLNTIRHADEILVIDQGRIVQAGDHDTLMAEEGIYRRFITARSNPTGWCR
ncbi:ABC transporter ATP-binding protein [Intestinimonas butyriciproducens]|uniref:ABC transporter ATP-binding protein n=1 Tax=Intestinimonas butyriciproducens TaxID=1297617 RepID=UPI00195C0F90|nr:ABC transporter ATP-binding protein [Intestinimonas butyriciproducens]MBM6917989.1 ABC transporter ATP-binding protein [Intestinimonas butyriciproducens]